MPRLRGSDNRSVSYCGSLAGVSSTSPARLTERSKQLACSTVDPVNVNCLASKGQGAFIGRSRKYKDSEIGLQETSSTFARSNIRNTSIRSATRSLRLAPDVNCSTKFIQLQGMYDFLASGPESGCVGHACIRPKLLSKVARAKLGPISWSWAKGSSVAQ
jgi:hypothetical protein